MQWKAELLGVRPPVWACALLGVGSAVLLTELRPERGTMDDQVLVSHSQRPPVRSNPASLVYVSHPAERQKATMLQRLSDPDADIRLKTLEGLDALDLPRTECVPLLITCLSDVDARVRAYAVLLLGSLSTAASEAVPALKHLARTDADELVRSRAKDALYNIRLYDYSPMMRDL